MLGAVVLQLAALGLGVLASDCSPYSEVPIWVIIESASMESTVASTATKSYSVVPINTWTPEPTSPVWALGAHTALETRIAARTTGNSLGGLVGSHNSDRGAGTSLISDDTPVQSGPGKCNGKIRRFNCISPGDKWQECSSNEWSGVIPIGKLGGVVTTCTNYGIHPFLKLSYLPGTAVDTPVMTGPCDPDAVKNAPVANSKRAVASGLYNCIWPGFEYQTCSDVKTWTNPSPMQGGIHCISWGVKTYLTTDEIPVPFMK